MFPIRTYNYQPEFWDDTYSRKQLRKMSQFMPVGVENKLTAYW